MDPKLKDLSNAIRFLSIDAVQKANSGHPGMPMGMADVATVLFKYYLRFNPKNPSWVNRDRFILSAGHGSMLLYSLLYLTGYKKIKLDDILQSKNDSYSFFTESIIILSLKKYKIAEIPVLLPKRFSGSSKMRLADVCYGFFYTIFIFLKKRLINF